MWLGFCVYGGVWVFCLMLVVGYLFIVMDEFFVYGSDCIFVLMVVIVFFVYWWWWVFCLWWWLSFLFNVSGGFFCLL